MPTPTTKKKEERHLCRCLWNAQGVLSCESDVERFGVERFGDSSTKVQTRNIYGGASMIGGDYPASIVAAAGHSRNRGRGVAPQSDVIRIREPVAEKARRDAAYEIDCGGGSSHHCVYRGYAGGLRPLHPPQWQQPPPAR